MLDIRSVTPTFSVAPQIAPEDLPEIARRGFRLVVNNRPDHEAPDQPTSAEIQDAAEACGLRYLSIPVVGGPSEAQVSALAQALDEADGPVLAFCRSGTRSITTWALGRRAAGNAAEALAAGRAAGYDLSPALGRG